MNKKITLSALTLLFSCFLLAQQAANTDFRNSTLQVFQNLDKSRIPHGILLDFGMEFTNLQAFDGVLRDSTYADSQTITDVYKTLLMSRVNQASTGFITPQEYATRWYSQRETGIMTLSGMYFKYSRFSDSAYPSRLNYVNNQFSDKFNSGIWQNPYEDKQLFVMAPAVTEYKELSMQVKLPANLFLSNYPAAVQNIHIDFGDGAGFRTVSLNQVLNITYSLPSVYTWQYKITLTNGQILLSHSKITVGEPQIRECNTCNHEPYSKSAAASAVSTITGYTKVPITATVPYNGQYGKAMLYIRYGAGRTSIQKPLIVAEGFDTGAILTPEQEGGSFNVNHFFRFVDLSNSGLPAALSTYDVIFVDWNNGVDFIQKNAYVLEEAIKYVNAQKASAGSTTPNVVLGQSMGGLVVRYALRDIELKRNFNHDTQLYVSHDSPHLGANTPISVQYALRHIRNVYVSSPIPLALAEIDLPIIFNLANGIIQSINNNTNWTVDGQPLQEVDYVTPLTAFSVSDTPAARQMMYNWINRKYELKNGIHDIWQQELNTMGYPQGYPGKPIRNIAIANGSECGITQPDNGNIMSYIKSAGKDTFLSNYVGIMDGIYGTVLTRPDIVTASLFPGKSYWDIDFQSRYMTTLNENKNLYHGSIKYKKKVFWFIPVSITVTQKDMPQPANVLPYDIYGGGRQITDADQIPLSGITSNSFGFIPTASSLDIGKGSTPINDADYRKSYVGALPPAAPKNSGFQNFVTDFNRNNPASSNSQHISFTTRNGNWLAAELAALATQNPVTPRSNCSFICSDAQITGSADLCSTNVYTVPNSAQTYNWFVSQGANLVALSANGTPSVSLQLLSPRATGQIILNLYMESADCGGRTLSKTINVGNIPVTSSISGPSELCENQTAIYTVPGTCAAVPVIQWSVSPNMTILSQSGYSVTLKENTGMAGKAVLTATFPSDGSTMTRYLEIGDDEFFAVTKSVFQYPTDLYNNYVYNGNLIFNMIVLPKNMDSEYTYSNFKVNGVPVTISTERRAKGLHTFWVPMYLANEVECPMLEYTLTCTSRCNVTRSIQGMIPITCAGSIGPDPFDPFEPFEPLQNRTASEQQLSYKIYPNPSSQTLNISLADEKYRPVSSSFISAELYNIAGDLKSTVAIKNHTAQLDVSSLPLGVYVLRINVDGKIESHQVLVK